MISQSVPRIHRREFVKFIQKTYPEYFDAKEIQNIMDEVVHKEDNNAEEIENHFISTHTHEEFLPLFDFPINLNESDW